MSNDEFAQLQATTQRLFAAWCDARSRCDEMFATYRDSQALVEAEIKARDIDRLVQMRLEEERNAAVQSDN